MSSSFLFVGQNCSKRPLVVNVNGTQHTVERLINRERLLIDIMRLVSMRKVDFRKDENSTICFSYAHFWINSRKVPLEISQRSRD